VKNKQVKRSNVGKIESDDEDEVTEHTNNAKLPSKYEFLLEKLHQSFASELKSISEKLSNLNTSSKRPSSEIDYEKERLKEMLSETSRKVQELERSLLRSKPEKKVEKKPPLFSSSDEISSIEDIGPLEEDDTEVEDVEPVMKPVFVKQPLPETKTDFSKFNSKQLAQFSKVLGNQSGNYLSISFNFRKTSR
jgi:predicted RNase H-like nuclease (RuvC/YqgF family)